MFCGNSPFTNFLVRLFTATPFVKVVPCANKDIRASDKAIMVLCENGNIYGIGKSSFGNMLNMNSNFVDWNLLQTALSSFNSIINARDKTMLVSPSCPLFSYLSESTCSKTCSSFVYQ